ncbi:MAG: sulfatase-like hydrolase/transferase [Sedimentisphaerales bacterium]|nr:sulfatase-like hydrolase/transferase [Sedimentisphaerales bacterium]
MNRRDFLRALGAGVASTAMGGTVVASAAAGDSNTRPNLLMIHTDQLSSWAISAYAGRLKRVPNYGKVLVETPHIDSLAAEGALLENFFTNSAVCTPSRGCLLTGRYPHAHGAYRNNIEMNRDEMTLARVLQGQGYETGYAGKWHLDGPPKPGWLKPERSMGFADCRFMFNRGHWKKIEDRPGSDPKAHPYGVIGDETSFTTDWLAGKTIDFIRKVHRRPFFYLVSFPDPHTPFTVREPYMSMYDPEDMIVPHTFKQAASVKGKASMEERLRRSKAHYCGQVKCIDDNVGRILDALREKRILDHTVIVFTTDHGEYMGEHGLYGKNRWYRTAYQVPFLVRWPKRIPGGTVVGEFVTNVDVQQTLLGLMGIPPCGREQGRDASGLLGGRDVDWKNEAMIHHSSLESAGVFTPEYELVLAADGNHIFFDRTDDPEQTRNLCGHEEHKAIFNTLKRQIVQHHEEVKSPAHAWLAKL